MMRLLALFAVMTLTGCANTDAASFPAASTEGGAGGSAADDANGAGGGSAEACVDLGDPCTSCELRECGDAYCECQGNDACLALGGCAVGCAAGDYDCYQACWSKQPTGITDLAIVNDCAAERCSDECAQFALIDLDDCEHCLYSHCEATMNSCVSNAACMGYWSCYESCADDGACQDGCADEYPGGVIDASFVASCAQQECATSC